MNIVTDCGPPARGKSTPGKYEPLFDAARANAPEWVAVDMRAEGIHRAMSSYIKQGRLTGCEPDEFEVKTRTQEDGALWMYLRVAQKENTQ